MRYVVVLLEDVLLFVLFQHVVHEINIFNVTKQKFLAIYLLNLMKVLSDKMKSVEGIVSYNY